MRYTSQVVVMLAGLLVAGQVVAQPAELPPPPAPKPAPAPRRPAPKGTPKKVDLAPEIAALSGADDDAAMVAATSLGTSEQPAAHDALLDALAFGLPSRVAVAALAALTQHPAPADVQALRRYAGHHTPTVRAAAINALASYPNPEARAAIAGALRDPAGLVRTAAAGAAAKGRVRDAVEPMIKLLAKGEESSARSLAAIADPDLARKLADQYGKVPDASLALALGLILKRQDFGPDPARVEIVRAMAKIQDIAATNQLKDYLDVTPKNPPRPSRQEAEMVWSARTGGGK
jgi:HEAT repeat protein